MIKNLQTEFRPKLTPMKHQEEIFNLTKNFPYYGLFWDMGTGKSKIIIDTSAHLFLSKEIDGVVILSDNGCIGNWTKIGGEIEKHLQEDIIYRAVLHSSYMDRNEQRDVEEILVAQDDVLDFLCVNVEAMSRGKAIGVVNTFIKNHYCLFVVDEATSIKNEKSDRCKNILQLARKTDYRRILTGTPITQSPLDLFSMCEFLQPGILGYRSFIAFKADHAIVKQVPSGRWHYDIILGYQNLDKLSESIKGFTSRILKSECMDLPEKIYETIEVSWTPEQEDAYFNLKNTAILQLEQGLLTSTTAIATIMKLHQINCGHIKLDDEVVVDFPSNRVIVLMDTLEKLLPEKVVVWCRFQHDVELIMTALKKRFEKTSYIGVHYYGNTNERDREIHLHQFQYHENCKWFVGTAATGGKGIDGLQNACSYEIYYSNSYDREDRAQSEDRLHRKGQVNKVTIIDLEVPKTVDTKIRQSLKAKEDLAYQVLDRLRGILS
jgi:SNF2 family DNA or RNA helicase